MSKNRIDEIYNMILDHDGDFDAVAQSITADLNAALTKYKDQSKETDAQKLADHFNAFISVHYPNSKVKYTAQMILDAMDFETKFTNVNNISDAIDAFCDILNKFEPENLNSEPKTLEEMLKNKGW
jgi:hypothetical protein